jgi:hypothetical protein
MKSFKYISASLLALSLVGAASAQTVIRVTGSTAYRNATEQCIQVALKSGYIWGGIGKTVGGTQLIYSGNLASNNDAVIVLTAFTGSEGGVYNLTHATPPSNATYVNQTSTVLSALTNAGTVLATTTPATDNTSADISLADTFQSSSAYKTPALVDTQVGVVPFLWVAATTNDAGISNMTNQLAKIALNNQATLALWTGDHSAGNEATPVYVIGRDEDSGTRLNTFAESTFGIFSGPTQYAPVGTAGSYTGIQPYPANTVNFVSYPAGHSGYSTGGSVATVIEDPTITNSSEIIGYIGTSDAFSGLAPASGSPTLAPLSWNGIVFGTAATGGSYGTVYNESVIQNGSYTFWSYEHLFVRSGTLSTDVAAFKTAIVAELLTGTEIIAQKSGYKLSDLGSLTRTTDGSPVFFTN